MRAQTIRRLTTADLPGLASVDPHLAESERRRRVVGRLVEQGMSWVAESDGAPVGFAIASRNFYDWPFVDLLVVAESARRAGVGSALMRQCAEAHEEDRTFTSTNESNAPMRALLAKAGWDASGQIDNLDPGDPELVYVKWRKG